MAVRERLKTLGRRMTIRYWLIAVGLLMVVWLFSTVAFNNAGVLFLLAVGVVVLLGVIPMGAGRRRRYRRMG